MWCSLGSRNYRSVIRVHIVLQRSRAQEKRTALGQHDLTREIHARSMSACVHENRCLGSLFPQALYFVELLWMKCRGVCSVFSSTDPVVRDSMTHIHIVSIFTVCRRSTETGAGLDQIASRWRRREGKINTPHKSVICFSLAQLHLVPVCIRAIAVRSTDPERHPRGVHGWGP